MLPVFNDDVQDHLDLNKGISYYESVINVF